MVASASAVLAAWLLAWPAGSSAKIIRWGSNLSATPTLDTGNGASHATGGRSTEHAIVPNPHDGADLAVWNTRIGSGLSAGAPRGGQVRQVRIKGCAVEDTAAPSQLSAGTPVNTINFQTLARRRGGSYRATATAPYFHLPFCSNSANPASGRVSTSTITTFNPIHLCISKGNTVAFEDIGGFVPGLSGAQGFYPQGVPFEVIARVRGSSMQSFADADAAAGLYAPGARPRGGFSGFGSEPGEQLMLQVVEGTGAQAYGLCPGGKANEPGNSNQIVH